MLRPLLIPLLALQCVCVLGTDNVVPRSAGAASTEDLFGIADLTSWPTVGPGVKITSRQQPSQELAGMLDQINTTRIEEIITHLVTYGTRHTMSVQDNATHGIGGARDWIKQEMQAIADTSNGFMTITTPNYTQQPEGSITAPVLITDVVATLVGADEPNRVYVVSGHYDSRNSDILDGVNDAPGADDDASGVAVIMELARVFAQTRSPATMIFAAVAGEEQGLYGADHLAGVLQAAGADVQGMFTNDIVGSSKTSDGLNVSDPHSIRLFAQGIPSFESQSVISEFETAGAENDSPARELGRFTAEVASNDVTDMTVRVITRLDRFNRGGDHEPFLQRGWAANRFTEPYEDFRHQHQDVRVQDGVQFGDLAEYVDFDFTTRVGKVNGAVMWSLANAPGTPKNVTLNSSVLANNSTLKWAANPAKGLAGYEVVWRPSDSMFWTNAVPVGNVRTVTLPLDKDNVKMGVRAVGTNGMRSPAAFPNDS